ncbi:MAG: hypothetical protein GXP49_02615, partial [Deltaproteobacteria bacterium]|nr:hypothetical protein [Deltaproteobacteria bacterium]
SSGDGAGIFNSIIWQAGDNGYGYRESVLQPPEGVHVEYSIIAGGASGNGNIDSDPMFVRPDELNFHLQAESPAIDAASGLYAPAVDIEGQPRFDVPDRPNAFDCSDIKEDCVNAADIGAYEFRP